MYSSGKNCSAILCNQFQTIYKSWFSLNREDIKTVKDVFLQFEKINFCMRIDEKKLPIPSPSW